MTDNRTIELLKDYAFALRRLEYDADKPGSNMTLGEYETEEKRVTDEYAQAIAATVGNGTLTAEQVMSIARKHQPDYCSDTHVCFDWQAIADELNAELGSGTCEFELNTDMTAIRCDKCGYELPKGTDLKATRFCGGCGKAVTR